ncbi:MULTISPECIES: GGDEF domain-containing protein [unclassified Rhizobium]|uniref:GGDEF domain-containing protein n=1 Tax=unclassified Rhizobium TaxID=2613769 RepID=UPI001ADA1247|nr:MULTISPECIES: GGDEF domain-containing protein [unclassified Rhizobium]MBO9123381.1 GGDEF domain-containing protein [Rhizobium sp. 16-488-2b]MBO9173913.1 GGDEF domain-containing protein [Rhizobium sp. 16-488-2a]MBO9193718.1 GGDEF domain-containing protein [Rhizobium sp. 16-449-1b]
MASAASSPQAQRETSRPAPVTDIQRISQHMTRLGVSGLPRNYELFHEAIVGQNAALAQDIASLGAAPRQPSLDELGLKYRLVSHCGLVGETSQAEMSKMLRDAVERLTSGVKQKQSFMRAAETALKSITGSPDQSLSSFMSEMEFLSTSLAGLLTAETDLETKLRHDVDRMEALERGVAAAQTASSTDRLTGLPNRTALNKTVLDLYEREEGSAGSALIMMDIDDFKALNSRYGTQTGSRLLKKLADLFRKSIKKHDFVARTDGDEFTFLFANVGMQEAMAIAERLRNSVEENVVFATSDAGQNAKLTVSLGVALSADAATASQLQANARIALHAAQSNRRLPVQAFGR